MCGIWDREKCPVYQVFRFRCPDRRCRVAIVILTRTILKLTSTGSFQSFPSILTTTGGKELAI